MKSVKNSRGQVAIFIAFIFQVLFLFFAMVVNIGLVVHDKINLQNSVDIAAYYGAQQQAEWLNVIAHTNYQIRQAWKLLTFRYRVLGTMGQVRQGISQVETHPAQMGGRDDESLYSAYQSSPPATCIGYSPTWEVGNVSNNTENLCKSPSLQFPKFPTFSTNFWNPLTLQVSQEIKKIQQQFESRCTDKAAANWIYAMMIHTSYRYDQADRRRFIDAIAANMAHNGDKFLSIDGALVSDGVEKTFLKNLTYGNWDGATNKPQLNTYNSMQGVAPEQWLVPILASPQMMFVDVLDPNTCASQPTSVFNQSGNPFARQENLNQARNWVGSGIFDILRHWSRYVEPTTLLAGNGYDHNTLGVEKNPWYMVYYGVKAKAESRQLFLPFGATVSLEAKAFAKPFGGRVGPWFSRTWSPDSPQSDPTGGDRSRMNDPLLPSRMQVGGLGAVITTDFREYPNYSRFPGDTLGMNSRRALSIFGESPGNYLASFLNLLRLDYFRNVMIENSPGNNYLRDPLTWNNDLNQKPVIREYEEASVAPDLFDITHYSIQSNFGNTYLPKLKALQQSGKMFAGLAPIRGDLGYKPEVSESYSVLDQLKLVLGAGVTRRVKDVGSVNYMIEDYAHLLTGWVSEGANRYPASPAEFAECPLPLKNTDTTQRPQTPTQCISGGRSGYSVKIIHEDYLNSTLNLGGTGGAQIKNLPIDL